MKQFFEGAVVFLEEGADKPTKQIYLIDGTTYTEAEAHATKYMVDFIGVKDFSINKLTKVAFDDVIYRNEDEDYNWHEIMAKFKVDADKEIREIYLVADKNTESAISQVREYLKDTDGEWRIASAKERFIDDLILFKLCCESCDTCESNVRVVSFEEQKEIDLSVGEMESKRKEEMIRLGAFGMTFTKYKVKADEENLTAYALGKQLAAGVHRKWTEDFLDEDTGKVVTIDRTEIMLGRGTYIQDYHIQEIVSSGVEFVTLYK